MAATPMKEPISEAEKMLKSIERQPRNAPIMASSLISPPPIPSFPVNFAYPHATRKREPPPSRMPRREFSQPFQGRKREKMNPTAMPGREISSGMIWWSRSMKVMTTRLEQKRKADNRDIVMPAYPAAALRAGRGRADNRLLFRQAIDADVEKGTDDRSKGECEYVERNWKGHCFSRC